ncbi:MAG: DUF3332 domain-containing protein [Duncaniella sp.]|nr:DUF3332 domain-containing protein [Duncaniella sp.]
MKKHILTRAIILAMCAGMVSTSCIGKFQLTRNLLNWNKNISSKFVNELVFIALCIVPVYEVSALADLIVLNSIEFWSGSNPLAAGTKVIDGKDGRYLVECDGKGYTITSENDNSVVRLDFIDETDTWTLSIPGGDSYELMTFVDDTHVALPAPDGTRRIVELSQDGLLAYDTMVKQALELRAQL